MGKARNFIGSYECIRTLLRDIFLYGCYTIDDFEKKGISPSKYNQAKRKLLGFIDSRYVGSQRINGKVAIHFTYDMFDVTYNYLFDTFMMKSFVESDVRISLKIMQVLSVSGSALTLEELVQMLELTDGSIESLTVYRVLVELEEQGYILTVRTRKPYRYSLAEDIFESLSQEELLQLTYAVDLLRNNEYPLVCGNLLFDTLTRYGRLYRGFNPYNNPFLIKHNHMVQVLDEDIMWQLLIALNKSSAVSLDYQGRSYPELYPLKLVADEYYGRQYLFSVSITKDNIQPYLHRLDKISNLQIKSSKPENSAQLTEIYSSNMRNSFNGLCLPKCNKTYTVSLLIKREVFPMVEQRLETASIKAEDSDFIYADLLSNDPYEIKPWLRRYTGKIFVQKSDEHSLAEDMELELAEWRALYEDIQRTEE